MTEKPKQMPEPDRPSDTGSHCIMGVPIEEVNAAMMEAAWSAQRLHEAHGAPMVIWRDGKVVEVSPAEFKAMLEDDERKRVGRIPHIANNP